MLTWRMPRNRSGARSSAASSSGATASPSRRSAWPTIAAQTRQSLSGSPRADAVGELDLAERAQRFRRLGVRERERLDVDRRDDAMAGARIGQVVVDHVAQRRPVEQVVVRVDDRQFGLEDGLAAARVQLREGAGEGHRVPVPVMRMTDAKSATRSRFITDSTTPSICAGVSTPSALWRNFAAISASLISDSGSGEGEPFG